MPIHEVSYVGVTVVSKQHFPGVSEALEFDCPLYGLASDIENVDIIGDRVKDVGLVIVNFDIIWGRTYGSDMVLDIAIIEVYPADSFGQAVNNI